LRQIEKKKPPSWQAKMARRLVKNKLRPKLEGNGTERSRAKEARSGRPRGGKKKGYITREKYYLQGIGKKKKKKLQGAPGGGGIGCRTAPQPGHHILCEIGKRGGNEKRFVEGGPKGGCLEQQENRRGGESQLKPTGRLIPGQNCQKGLEMVKMGGGGQKPWRRKGGGGNGVGLAK